MSGSSDHLTWQRSSFCASGGCVEVAHSAGTVLVRNSTDPDGPHLEFGRSMWKDLMDGIRAGRLEGHRQPD